MQKIEVLIPENKLCGVNIYALLLVNAMKRKKDLLVEKYFFRKTNNPLYYYSLAKKVSKEVDLIHLQHEFGLFGLFGLNFVFFSLGCRKPLVVSFHEFHTSRLIQYFKEKISSFLTEKKISKIIVLSDKGEELAKKFFRKTQIVNTGHGIQKRGRVGKLGVHKRPVIVHPGFIRLNKNQEFTIELAKKFPEFDFVLAGSGSGPYYEKTVNQLKGAPNAKKILCTSDKRYFDAIVGADVIVFPYTDIVQSGALFSALSFKKIAVCSDTGFFKSMEKEGILITEKLELESFGKALLKAVFEKNLRKRIFGNLEKFIEKNSFEKIAEKNIKIYKEVLAECQK